MFKGHPKGLIAAALANMGERFGFYTMMAILSLFIVSKFGLDVTTTGYIYATFYALIYILSLVGGVIADKTRNFKGTILAGLVVMALGYLLMAFPTPTPVPNMGLYLTLTLVGLFVIAFGNGLFKGNLQALVGELWRLIGPDTDVPAGDIGVGGKEIGYMYGMYKKLARENTGVLTGKGLNWGGSLIRPEATGFGTVYFAKEMLATKGETFEGKTVAVSGFGNVAWGAALKVEELGGKVVTLSGPDGYIHDPEGITGEKIEYMLELRASNQDIVAPYAEEYPEATFYANKRPWEVKCDVALPCATQNELDEEDAMKLVENGCQCVAEGANMPSTPEAVVVFQNNRVLFGPGKAVNAGGVATSGLEMTQNAMKLAWTREEVDEKLHRIMCSIHDACVAHGKREDGTIDYVKGANVAGFLKVANSMLDLGIA